MNLKINLINVIQALVKLKNQNEDTLNAQYFAMSQNKFNPDENFNENDIRGTKQNESPLMKIVRDSNQLSTSKVMSSNNLDLFNGNITIA